MVVVLGHPEYYPRLGFVPAAQKGLRFEYAVADNVFMVAELAMLQQLNVGYNGL